MIGRTVADRANGDRFEPSPSSDSSVRLITYRPGRLMLTAVGFGVLTPGVGALALLIGGPRGLVMALAAAAMGAYAVASSVRAIGDRTALRYDATGLTVRTLWFCRSAPWCDIGQITLRRTRTYACFGLIPVSNRTSLIVRFDRGVLGRKMTLDLPFLDLGGLSIETIAMELAALQNRGIDRAASILALRSPGPQGSLARRFDPDAAIACPPTVSHPMTSAINATPTFSPLGTKRVVFGRRRG